MKILALLFLSAICFTAFAQKLPAVQQKSLRAPANIKIDGKATEWGGKFEAYNPATDVSYSMANDDKKLYLVVQTTSWTVLTNIANGGVKLIIQRNGSKSDTGAPFIKFPYMVKSTIIIDPKTPPNAVDEKIMVENYKELAQAKWIYTRGLAGVDTLISIYNDRGIDVANAFDVKRKYTLEMAIDLSLLGLPADKFSYHIMVNAEPNRYTRNGIMELFKSVSDRTPGGLTPAMQQNVEKFQRATANATAPTDFWGEYTLAK